MSDRAGLNPWRIIRRQLKLVGKPQDEGGGSVSSLSTELESLRRVQQKHQRALRDVEHVEALANLYSVVRPDRRLPHRTAWAAAPDLVLLLVELIRQRRPALVVECGSGWSTLWLALALERFDVPGKVVALEHAEKYVRQTRDLIDAGGVSSFADVRVAPLEPMAIDGEEWSWYAQDAWKDLSGCGLLLVDGPPKHTGPLARYPGLPALSRGLAEEFVLVLDDARRAGEREIVERWRRLCPDLEQLDISLAKGAVVLYRGGAPLL